MLYRGCSLDGLETKQVSDELGEFTGVASTGDRDLADDIIEPGAFGTINPKSVVMLRDHDPRSIIGGYTAMEQTGNQLKVAGKILLSDRCPKGQETYELLKYGFVNGLSVGFKVRDPRKDIVYDEARNVRRIKAGVLLECSIVAIPANPKARVGTVKSFARPDVVEWLRESGFGSDDIDVLMTRGFDALQARADPSPPPDPTAPLAAEVRALLDQLKGLHHGRL